MRLGFGMRYRRTVGLVTVSLAAVSLLFAAGFVMTLALGSSSEAARDREELRADLDAALELQGEIGAKDATISGLRAQIASLEGEIDGLNTRLTDEIEARSLSEAEVGRLTQLIADSGIAVGQLAELQNRYDVLLAQYKDLQESHDAATLRLAQLVPIESTELSAPALYLDSALPEVATTRPLCSGSMEPTITCDDLLVLYEPASPTDLDEGDVIYFRKPNESCTGALDGRFTLHRISNVISNSDGLFFQTKGDAFTNPDRCLVPAEDVIYKLLTSVRNGRVAQ